MVLLSSCARARLNHFRNFSQAGAAYTRAVSVVLDEAGATAVEANSLLAVADRPLSEKERGEFINKNNELMRARLAILGDLKRHAQLLRSYFDALAALADGDASSGVGTAAQGAVQSLGTLHPRITKASVGGLSVASLVGSVAKIVVARFQVAALEKELKANAQTIERELDLQRAALSAIARILRTDLQIQVQQRESQEVVIPYVKDAALAPAWRQRRRELLVAQASVTSADAAVEAARQLQLAFVALSEGRGRLVDVPAMISDINDILTLIEKVKGEKK